jgi:putative RNA 2'-phosphotransferase
MISQKTKFKLSKFLSLVLRHKPQEIGIHLDENGWTSVDELINKMNEKGKEVDLELLTEVVETNDKKRFAFNDDKTLIRANQGHSVSIDLGYEPKDPPVVLYHGTGEKYYESIMKIGLDKRNRHHVHMSKDKNTAITVGKRHGKPIIFEIDTKQMLEDGHSFFESDNGVWLTNNVPVKYLKTI